MNKIKDLSIAFLIGIGTLFFLTTLFVVLYYFNIISTNIFNILQLLSVLISCMTSGFLSGKKSKVKGFLEGMKMGLIYFFLFIMISFLLLNNSFTLFNIVYYLSLIAIASLGGIVGINYKKDI